MTKRFHSAIKQKIKHNLHTNNRKIAYTEGYTYDLQI